MKLSRLLLLASALLMAGCTHNIGDFTILSTNNVDFSVIAGSRRGAQVEGVDIQHIIIFFPTSGVPNLKTAIDRAIESVPGTIALVDARLRFRSFYIPYLYGQNAYLAEGRALVNPAQVSHFPTKHIVVTYDAKQDRFIAKPVSVVQYEALKRKYAFAAQS